MRSWPRQKMVKLTEKQRQVLRFIIEYSGRYGYPPSLREINTRIGATSSNSAFQYLEALERKGYIERQPRTSRAIRVLKRPD